MKTHQQIDERSLALARAIAHKIDGDPSRGDLAKAGAVCRRWRQRGAGPATQEWLHILQRPWEDVRRVLLERSDEAKRLRQSSPFCGILTPKERWEIYRMFRDNET